MIFLSLNVALYKCNLTKNVELHFICWAIQPTCFIYSEEELMSHIKVNLGLRINIKVVWNVRMKEAFGDQIIKTKKMGSFDQHITSHWMKTKFCNTLTGNDWLKET